MSLIKAASHYGLARKRYKFEMKIHRLILPTSANKLLARVLWTRRKKHSEQYKTNWTEGIEEFDINQVIVHNATIFLTAKTNQFQSKQTSVSIEIRNESTDRHHSKYCCIKLDLSDFINIQHPNKIFSKHLRYKNNKGTKKAELIFSIKSTELTNSSDNDSSLSNNDTTSSILSAVSNEDTSSRTISDHNLSSNKDASNASVVTMHTLHMQPSYNHSQLHTGDLESIQFQELKRNYVANQRKLLDSSNPILAASKSSNNHSSHTAVTREQQQNTNTSPITITRHSNQANHHSPRYNHHSYDVTEQQHKKPASPYLVYTKYAQRQQQQERKLEDEKEFNFRVLAKQKRLFIDDDEEREDAEEEEDEDEEEKDEDDDHHEDELSENPPPFLLHTPYGADDHELAEHKKMSYEQRSSIINNAYSPKNGSNRSSMTPISNDTPYSLNQQVSVQNNSCKTTKNEKFASMPDLRPNHRQKQRQKHKHKRKYKHKNGKKKRKSIAGAAIAICSTDDDEEEEQEDEKQEQEIVAETKNGDHLEQQQLTPLRSVSSYQPPCSWSLSLNRNRNRSIQSVGTAASVDLDGLDLATMTPSCGGTVTGGGLNHDELEELRQLRLDKIYYASKMIEYEKMRAKLASNENEMETLNKKVKILQRDNNRLQLKVSSLQTVIEHHKNEKTNSFGTFKYMSYDECDKLKVGDYIDHRDETGHFLLAKIINKKKNFFHIHYEGWNSKWDIWINYKKQTQAAHKKIAMARSISRKSNTRFIDLQIGENIDVHPTQRHRGWRPGKIKKLDKYSGQVQVEYVHDDEKYFYWAHLNDVTEIAPFMTKACDI